MEISTDIVDNYVMPQTNRIHRTWIYL